MLDVSVFLLDLNADGDVLPPLSVFQYAAAFFDRLEVRRFVPGMCIGTDNFLLTFNVIWCLLLLVLGCDTGLILMVEDPLGYDVPAL